MGQTSRWRKREWHQSISGIASASLVGLRIRYVLFAAYSSPNLCATFTIRTIPVNAARAMMILSRQGDRGGWGSRSDHSFNMVRSCQSGKRCASRVRASRERRVLEKARDLPPGAVIGWPRQDGAFLSLPLLQLCANRVQHPLILGQPATRRSCRRSRYIPSARMSSVGAAQTVIMA